VESLVIHFWSRKGGERDAVDMLSQSSLATTAARTVNRAILAHG
jgi:hypothetical protein